MMTKECSYHDDLEVFLGSTPKYRLEIEADLPMSDFDFEVRFTCGEKFLVMKREDLILDESGEYYLYLDTEHLGAGVVKAVVYAYIPDSGISGGIRKEIFVMPKPITIKRP